MSRHFHGLICVKESRHSVECQVRLIKARLKEGLDVLTTLQQLVNSKEKVEEQKRVETVLQDELECVVMDVAAALLGKNIKFEEDLEYPPSPPNGEVK